MNDNKQHNQLNEAFAHAHEQVEAAALSMWQTQGLVNALALINRSDCDGSKEGQQMQESLLAALHEKIDATHQMLSQLETQMLHQINS